MTKIASRGGPALNKGLVNNYPTNVPTWEHGLFQLVHFHSEQKNNFGIENMREQGCWSPKEGFFKN